MVTIENVVRDPIYDQITISATDFNKLNNSFITKEMERLEKIHHLGLISKLQRFARHDKLEHSYGMYHLSKLLTDNTQNLVKDKTPFHLAAFLHNIGHLPFSYDIENSISELYEIHEPTRIWINEMIDKCVEFVSPSNLGNRVPYVKSRLSYLFWHRWFSVYKLSQSQEFNNDIGKKIGIMLLDDKKVEFQLLNEIDDLDCVLRDLHYLVLGKLELKLELIMKDFKKDTIGRLRKSSFLEIINTTKECLKNNIYLGANEQCLASVISKTLINDVVNNKLLVCNLININDSQFENLIRKIHASDNLFDDFVKDVQKGTIKNIATFNCDTKKKSIVDMEKDIMGTNLNGIVKCHLNKGLFMQCVPNNYQGLALESGWVTNSVNITINHDSRKSLPKYIIGSLIKIESWFPENIFGTEMSSKEKAVEYILGFPIVVQFDRYAKDIEPILQKCLPKSDLKQDIFYEKWVLKDWAVVEAIFYNEYIWCKEHFQQFPEHFNSELIRNISDKASKKRLRRLSGETDQDYKERKERMLEYSNYLRGILFLRNNNKQGWILPSVKIIWNSNDSNDCSEVDLITVFVNKPYSNTVTLKLDELSYNDGITNKENNRSKFERIQHTVIGKFNNKVKVEGYFNNEKVL